MEHPLKLWWFKPCNFATYCRGECLLLGTPAAAGQPVFDGPLISSAVGYSTWNSTVFAARRRRPPLFRICNCEYCEGPDAADHRRGPYYYLLLPRDAVALGAASGDA